MTELPKECCDGLVSVLVEYGMTWSDADAKADAISVPHVVRERGNTTRNVGPIYTTEMMGWMGRCAFILMSSEPGISSTEALLALPSVEEAIEFSMTFDHQSFCNNLVSYVNLCKNEFVCMVRDLRLCERHNPLMVVYAMVLCSCLLGVRLREARGSRTGPHVYYGRTRDRSDQGWHCASEQSRFSSVSVGTGMHSARSHCRGYCCVRIRCIGSPSFGVVAARGIRFA